MSVALSFCDAGFSSHLPIVELLRLPDPLKTSLCSPHPQILTEMPQGIRIAWYHNKGILN